MTQSLSQRACAVLIAAMAATGGPRALSAQSPQDLPSAPEPQLALLQQSQPQQPSQPPSKPGQNQQTQPDQQKPPTQPDLSDLGFSTAQTQADPKMQARLDRRSHMLKVHQRLGIITLIPMTATLITGPMAKAKGHNGETIKEPTSANLDFHAALGGATAALYFASAWYAIDAPRIPGTKHRGPIRLHEALAFVHGPGMIATPILGVMAYNQENNGERVHGAASAHGTVAIVTVAAYGASILAVSWPPFHKHPGNH